MSSLILGKSWQYCDLDKELIKHLSIKASIPEAAARILALRGIDTPETISSFLEPSLSSLSDPWKMMDMDKAVNRLIMAVKKKEKIAVFGDYDADGVTASALVCQFLAQLNLDPIVYIPHREKEGYGLNKEALEQLASEGCNLIITVDCGISNSEEVEFAKELGMDVIITDHHEVPNVLPRAAAVINPKRPDCPFPFKELAGVGVAFNLVRALRTKLYRAGFWSGGNAPNLKNVLDLVAIGTIADVMPLLGDNRILVRAGLEMLDHGQRPGIYAFKMITRIGSPVTVDEVAYRIAPRLNAAGRMSHAKDAFRLLVEEDQAKSLHIAENLHRLNQARQSEEEAILQEAMEIIRSLGDRQSYVLGSHKWKKGVIGIVAGKLSEKFSKPVILFSVDGDLAHGSGRAPEEFNLYEILCNCSHHLEKFGGHKVAAGMCIRSEALNDFCNYFEDSVSERAATNMDLSRGIRVDFPISLNELMDPAFMKHYSLMEPFGHGFPAPVLAIKDYSLHDVRVVGKGHLKLVLSGDRSSHSRIDLIGWGHGDKISYMWDNIEVACVPLISKWSGQKRLELRLKDARYK